MLRSKLWVHWAIWASGVFPGLSRFRLSLISPVLTLRKREDGNCWCEVRQWFMTACPALRINRLIVHTRYSLGIQEIWVQLPALLWILWSLTFLVREVGIKNNSLFCLVSLNVMTSKKKETPLEKEAVRSRCCLEPRNTCNIIQQALWRTQCQSDKEKQRGIQGRTRTECKSR